jgi:hypothetical protein
MSEHRDPMQRTESEAWAVQRHAEEHGAGLEEQVTETCVWSGNRCTRHGAGLEHGQSEGWAVQRRNAEGHGQLQGGMGSAGGQV